MSNLRRRLVVTTVIALVGAFFGVAGTGHAYLRRWKRSILWLALTLGTMIILVNQYVPDPDAIEPLDPSSLPTEVLIPVFVVLGFSVFDALLLAYLDSQPSAESSAPLGEDGDDVGRSCPHCGKETDPELDFCTWCTEPLSMDENES